jgi:hypothetical protein
MALSLFIKMFHTRGAQFCLAITVVAALVVAASVFAGMDWHRNECKNDDPSIRTFLWKYDTTEGIALTYVIPNPNYEASRLKSSLQIIVTQEEKFAEYWEIGEVAAYYREDGKRKRALVEGPFPWKVNQSEAGKAISIWTLHRLTKHDYEIDLLLHKVKDGMSFKEVRTTIGNQEAFTFRVELLPNVQTYESVVNLPGTAGRK